MNEEIYDNEHTNSRDLDPLRNKDGYQTTSVNTSSSWLGENAQRSLGPNAAGTTSKTDSPEELSRSIDPQLFLSLHWAALRNPHLRPAERITLVSIVLTVHAAVNNTQITSVRIPAMRIAEQAGISKATAWRILSRAVEWGILERTKVPRGGSQYKFHNKMTNKEEIRYADLILYSLTADFTETLWTIVRLDPERTSHGGARRHCDSCGSEHLVLYCKECGALQNDDSLPSEFQDEPLVRVNAFQDEKRRQHIQQHTDELLQARKKNEISLDFTHL